MRADAIPIKINCLKSGPASSVAKERKISVAHERTAGAESHLAPAAALWQQRFSDASGGCSRILCYTGVLGTGTGRNLEQRVAPCLCVENSHSFLKESTCLEFIYVLIYTAKKIKGIAVKPQRSGSMLSRCSQGADRGFSVLKYLLAN